MTRPAWTRLLSPFGWAVLATFAAFLFLGGLTWCAFRDADKAEIGQTAAKARTEAAKDAVDIADKARDTEAANEALSRGNEDAIHKAPDSKLDPGLNRAGRDSLCKRAAYRDRPECVQRPDRP